MEPGVAIAVGNELSAAFEGMGYAGGEVGDFETEGVVAELVGGTRGGGRGDGVQELPEFDGQIGTFDPAGDDAHVAEGQHFVVAGMGTNWLSTGTFAVEELLIKITEALDVAGDQGYMGQPRDLVGGGIGHPFEFEDVGVTIVDIDITMTCI